MPPVRQKPGPKPRSPQLETPEHPEVPEHVVDDSPQLETPESPSEAPVSSQEAAHEPTEDAIPEVKLDEKGDTEVIETSAGGFPISEFGFGVGHPVDSSAPVRDEVWR